MWAGHTLHEREAVDEAAEMLERRDAELAAAKDRAAVAEASAGRLSALSGASQVSPSLPH